MQPSESNYPEDWLRISDKDLIRLERGLRDGDSEMAGFYLQQAVEKSLKAYLLSRGWKLRRIHDLEALLDDVVVLDATFERFRSACQRITAYYVIERYPLSLAVQPEITEQEVRQSWDAVRALLEVVRKVVRSERK
jgi:HEPN domain-containing protein